ncbi:mitomycin antibiotics/polyketide fumonisin biosynthesis protein [Mycolicibacterium sp.]|uniref:mitomycin antibiotics/polyketide fumonisin biosynthesis protein n=1 Tax=Mycolicibacterium sp. TaxID=2320850 RepID=UPI00355E0993
MADVEEFIRAGFVKVEQAAPREVADEARDLLWQQIGLSPDEPDRWAQPVVWTADLTGAGPFGQLSASDRLGGALDEICGPGGWEPRGSLGNIPVRFPGRSAADDRGWHVDLNTPLPDGSWAVSGRPQTVLLLTLLSNVGPDDAPTRIRVGSHRDVAKVLGDDLMGPVAAGGLVDRASTGRSVAHATGQAGDMYLVHPFTVHAADEHRGRTPRFMSQAPVALTAPLAPTTPSALAAAWRG